MGLPGGLMGFIEAHDRRTRCAKSKKSSTLQTNWQIGGASSCLRYVSFVNELKMKEKQHKASTGLPSKPAWSRAYLGVTLLRTSQQSCRTLNHQQLAHQKNNQRHQLKIPNTCPRHDVTGTWET